MHQGDREFCRTLVVSLLICSKVTLLAARICLAYADLIMNAQSNSLTHRHIELPIEGMTCAACAARIEKNLNKLPGVHAAVNFANEKARVEFDDNSTTLPEDLIRSVEQAGFHVIPQSVQLQISGMTCAACSGRIEKALNRLPGVTATVNLATETARTSFNPGTVTVDELIAAVVRAGYGASEISETSRAEEKARRLAAYHAELRLFWISAVLTLPLLLQMGAMFSGAHEDLLPRWLQWLLATPVNSGSASASMLPHGTRCAAAVPIWMCWSRLAPAWHIFSAQW